jgi:NAD+ kinase
MWCCCCHFHRCACQVIYGCQKLATCSIDAQDMGPNGNSLGVMITLRMRLHCAIVRAGQSQPEQVRLALASRGGVRLSCA